jgi:sphingomyelin synthase-related protein 1
MEEFSIEDVSNWLKENNFQEYVDQFKQQKIDGKTLSTLTEDDLKEYLDFKILGDMRSLIRLLRKSKKISFIQRTPSLNLTPRTNVSNEENSILENSPYKLKLHSFKEPEIWESPEESWGSSITKLSVSIAFTLFTIFMTSITMVIAHERVPNPMTYPPLPDFILDNVDRMPIAFELAEVCILCLGLVILTVLLFHKHRLIIFRRMCAIIGLVFLLRCLTMFMTSLSVPGKHLTNCGKKETLSIEEKFFKAWKITKGLGLSISGVYTW